MKLNLKVDPTLNHTPQITRQEVNHKFKEHKEKRTHRVSSAKRLPNSGGIIPLK